MRLCGVVFCAILAVQSLAFAKEPTEAEMQEAKEGMEQMQKLMQSPEYKKHMAEMKAQLKSKGIDPAMVDKQMQPMAHLHDNMSAAMAMNECVRKGLGDKGMAQMQKRNMELGNKLIALCKAGDEAGAKAYALDFATKSYNSAQHKVFVACTAEFQKKYKGDTSTDPLPGTPEFAARGGSYLRAFEVSFSGVIPAQAGIHLLICVHHKLDSGIRRSDDSDGALARNKVRLKSAW